MSLVPLKPGDRVLDLCCGTGLEALLAADIIGDGGEIVGIDVSEGMLDELQAKLEQHVPLAKIIRTVQHDVTHLEEVPDVTRGLFDVVLCCCGLSLLGDPKEVISHWKEYLKPGGVMVLDIAHERSTRSGYILEQIAEQLGVEFPWKRCWVTGEGSLKEILEEQGLKVDQVSLLDRIKDKAPVVHSIDDADSQYEWIINSGLTTNASEKFKINARQLFRKKWQEVAEEGGVEEIDALYVYVARRP
jgi:ubiquinone/menaquinone biosynthesis C-methylase UbiE